MIICLLLLCNVCRQITCTFVHRNIDKVFIGKMFIRKMFIRKMSIRKMSTYLKKCLFEKCLLKICLLEKMSIRNCLLYKSLLGWYLLDKVFVSKIKNNAAVHGDSPGSVISANSFSFRFKKRLNLRNVVVFVSKKEKIMMITMATKSFAGNCFNCFNYSHNFPSIRCCAAAVLIIGSNLFKIHQHCICASTHVRTYTKIKRSSLFEWFA
jgi:hypothetical protein